MSANVPLREWLAKEMQDPEFREAMEKLEPGYQVARLRMKRGLTQKDLSKLVGTRQSSISRLESGKSQPTLSFLRRIAKALKAQLILQLVPEEDQEATTSMMALSSRESNVISTTVVAVPESESALFSLWQASPNSPKVVILPAGGILQVETSDTLLCGASQPISSEDREAYEAILWSDHASAAVHLQRTGQ